MVPQISRGQLNPVVEIVGAFRMLVEGPLAHGADFGNCMRGHDGNWFERPVIPI